MKRSIETNLLRWKNQKTRMPLLVRGARQVGKSYIIERFGRTHFEFFVLVNFEQHPEYAGCFKTLDPIKIVAALELMAGIAIQPGKTLLFLDEIQECPQAILALRYFKEQLPSLHVIGAGSLLEFALNDAEFRMPVGRIEFLYLRPLSFTEYLEASGHNKLKEYLEHVNLKTSIEQPIHEKLMALIREYFALGGMPAVLAEYFESKSLLRVQEIQTSILATFRKDFGKYAHRMPHKHLETIFTKAPGLVGQWLKYSTLDPSVSPETLRNAIDKLCDAGLILLVHATSGSGLPLVSHKNEKKRKFLFLDIGLVKRACNLNLEVLMQEDLQLINQGALAEQFVGQELLIAIQAEEANALFAWKREEKSSSAEIDFLVAIDRWIVPIEVKSGSIGALRSLKLFMTEKKIPLGVRISASSLSLRDSILSIPFYLIEQLPRLVGEAYYAPAKT